MLTLHVPIELADFQQLCRLEPTTIVGYASPLEEEVKCEICIRGFGHDTMLASMQKPTIDIIEQNNILDPDVLHSILECMDQFGGSFVKQLSNLTRHADQVNRVKCVMTWTDLFLQYAKMRVPPPTPHE